MSDEVYFQTFVFALYQRRYTDGHRLKSLRLQSEVFLPRILKGYGSVSTMVICDRTIYIIITSSKLNVSLHQKLGSHVGP